MQHATPPYKTFCPLRSCSPTASQPVGTGSSKAGVYACCTALTSSSLHSLPGHLKASNGQTFGKQRPALSRRSVGGPLPCAYLAAVDLLKAASTAHPQAIFTILPAFPGSVDHHNHPSLTISNPLIANNETWHQTATTAADATLRCMSGGNITVGRILMPVLLLLLIICCLLTWPSTRL